ncbi:DNA polymerase III subunit delta [Lysobacter capsici]|jgi:DNA polymerase-3 subunit delta|uniref:DNA polymerase III subunit delta n=1 Tax=Lysobacter capsici AZ78 TaxID=1444315 RepID=A0A108U761_9GAMM|nr:DNA polymerase III subunit delta [Lysobacter capsici]MBW8809094.1 DNA polymerase III subunit delta [Lysobacter sp.]ALN85084.1 DNA polymerase III, delta subunit [Lysobacter capsici]ATE71304.1 DNA polymerase III subunit delta [Lysobacter capsici]KWS03779.1 DNA polymerase III delta subunit [Lysobacter capsici AZ78]UOF16601.1 DNA polymerase III subunit delta [Lysobacter capsici]
MELTPERLLGQLDNEALRPVYLIAGPEPLRVLEAADAVRAAARKQGIAEREIFEAEGNQREPDWNAMSASFRAPSLFASRRLLELRLPSGKPGKEGAEVISDFCADPPHDVSLLITAGDWSKQHGGKWSEAVGRIGHIAVAWAIKPHELPDWIERRLRARGLRADRDAVQSLADRVEGNLLAAAQEVDKLALLSDGETLDLERMQALVADAARFDVFRVLDAAMNGQGAQVSRMLAGLRAEGEAVPALLGMVVMELQRTAALARVSARGGNIASEFKAQRIWDSKQPMYRRALQRHDARRWELLLAQAGRVDRMAKGREAGDAWVALERLLLAVAEPRALRLLSVSAG